jgi:hypothetical protein
MWPSPPELQNRPVRFKERIAGDQSHDHITRVSEVQKPVEEKKRRLLEGAKEAAAYSLDGPGTSTLDVAKIP